MFIGPVVDQDKFDQYRNGLLSDIMLWQYYSTCIYSALAYLVTIFYSCAEHCLCVSVDNSYSVLSFSQFYVDVLCKE